jgi:hypothetical protein
MKKNFLILVTTLILILAGLAMAGCSSAAVAQPVVVEFFGSEFELSLPEGWDGGTKDEIEDVAEELEDLGQKDLAAKVKENKKLLLFFGYDSEGASQGGNLSNLTITGESAAFLSLDEYVKLAYEDLAKKYEKSGYELNILEQEIVSLGKHEEVSRTLFKQEVEGVSTGVAQYIIRHEGDFWVMTFTSGLEKFDENIKLFDKSVESFKILD